MQVKKLIYIVSCLLILILVGLYAIFLKFDHRSQRPNIISYFGRYFEAGSFGLLWLFQEHGLEIIKKTPDLSNEERDKLKALGYVN